jgi:hypothetical protein
MDSHGKLNFINLFYSGNKAAEFMGISRPTLLKYAKSDKLFNGIYKFSYSPMK